MIQNRRLITGAAFTALGLMGMTFSFLGTSLPSIRIFLGIDVERAGLLMAFLQLGFAVTNIAGGILSDLIPRDKVLMGGCFFLGASSLLFGRWPGFSPNLVVIILTGIGCGLILSSSNALLVGLYHERKGTILNLHHFFFAIGSLIGPLIMGSLIARHVKWQYGYDGLGSVVLVLFLIFLLTQTPRVRTGTQVNFHQIRRLMRRRDFVLLILMNFMTTGAQLAIMFFAVTFLKEARGFSIILSSIAFSAFFILLAVGRLVCSGLAGRIPNSKILLFLLFSLFFTLIVSWKGNGWFSFVGLVLSGLAFSGIFPSLLALTGTLFHDMAGTAMGILTMMGGLGGMVACWGTGLAAQRTDIGFGFVVPFAISLAALLLFLYHYRPFLAEERKSRISAGESDHRQE